jgi:hypothetical protein
MYRWRDYTKCSGRQKVPRRAAAFINRGMDKFNEPQTARPEAHSKPSKPRKGDPGWNEAYRRELIALRELGCFIPDDLIPKS